MTNELKKECGLGMYWCNTDNKCKPIQEDAPVNAVGDRFFNGNIAITQLYNTALSAGQVSQNFQADRARFEV